MKVLVMYSSGESQVMELSEICKEYRVTEKQILYAIKSGHHLKTMLFDKVVS